MRSLNRRATAHIYYMEATAWTRLQMRMLHREKQLYQTPIIFFIFAGYDKYFPFSY